MANDIAAWYEKYGPMVIRRCRELLRNDDDTMDAVQDVFLKLLKAEGGRFSFPSSLLYTIATNVCLDRLRAKKRRDVRETEETDFPAVDEGYEQVDAELLVQVILEDEPEETCKICYMYHADGMTFREIGEAVGMSVSGVQKKLETFKKRARLRMGRG
jgi:RNA polymerase sigma-70 factor (ECF subfamily)